ncbi:MAG: valine--tRNA ligase [Acidobacteria bacterium]|nr:valine--tRNA ligase [Acidobacteriota bacterium]
MTEIPKAYEPHSVEKKWYPFWKEQGYFKPAGDGPHYTITIPPPNVTGSLHAGHALCYTIHDTLIRWKRMQGYKTLCLPGTDHAGIATQAVVEKQLRQTEKLTRHDLGREKFVERIWDWVNQYGNVIINQMHGLGCSFDWDRTRFTLDEGYANAVLECFVKWWDAGLIYRGNRITNWCPQDLTAISDIEVEREDRKGKLYHLRYPYKDGSGFVVVATTRPETMLGDTAVAVNPKDERYSDHLGKALTLPLVGREIPLIADDFVDRAFGTGAVKVTPAHDANDYECGLRNGLAQIVVIDARGKMTDEAGEQYAGMDRFAARKKIVEDLEAQDLIEKIEDYTVPTALCDRCKTVIEPRLSEQWYVKMKELAQPAIEAVKDGRVRFIPERYNKIYLSWMENIKDWCISRQLWWGHRIPVWYTEDGEVFAARNEEEAKQKANGKAIRQDEDVLDTWFSSGLWPFATLGWPDQNAPDLQGFYPTNVLITAQEIIYLWVARMIMSGLYFMNEIPFPDVYIYATVLDMTGQRMSKNKGNGVDPLEVISLYGADALRFALLIRTAKGQDIRFAPLEKDKDKKPIRHKQVEEARNFGNKIWNASRFVLMNLGDAEPIAAKWVASDNLADRWILAQLNKTIEQVTAALDDYRMNDAAQTLYHFFWDDFCDWYIELSKALVTSTEPSDQATAARCRIVYVLEKSLRLLHPLMPFITEEIWQMLPHDGNSISIAEFPKFDAAHEDREAQAQMDTLIGVITKVRNIRSEVNVPQSSKVNLYLSTADDTAKQVINNNIENIKRLGRVEEIRLADTLPTIEASARGIVAGVDLLIPLAGLIDFAKERERIGKEISKRDNEAQGLATKLNNPSFVERASTDVVQQARERHAELVAELEKLKGSLKTLV